MIGVDPAAASLQVARRKPGAGAIRWVHGDACDLGGLAVELVTMTGNVPRGRRVAGWPRNDPRGARTGRAARLRNPRPCPAGVGELDRGDDPPPGGGGCGRTGHGRAGWEREGREQTGGGRGRGSSDRGRMGRGRGGRDRDGRDVGRADRDCAPLRLLRHHLRVRVGRGGAHLALDVALPGQGRAHRLAHCDRFRRRRGPGRAGPAGEGDGLRRSQAGYPGRRGDDASAAGSRVAGSRVAGSRVAGR